MDSVQAVKQEMAATPVRSSSPAESVGRSSSPVKGMAKGHLLGLVLAAIVVLAIAVMMGVLIWSPNWSSGRKPCLPWWDQTESNLPMPSRSIGNS